MLGGEHLHVNTLLRGVPTCFVCRDGETAIALGGECHDDCHLPPLESPKESGPSASVPSKAVRPIDVNLLLACRQIHQEAALIPFTKNTFRFGTLATSLVFVRELLARQRAAITNIAVLEPYWALHSYCPTRRGLFAKLPGLKHVRISMSVWVEEPTYAWPSVKDLKMRLEEVQKALNGRSLAQLTIDVTVGNHRRPGEEILKRLEPYKQLAREAEKAIMMSQVERS